MDTTPKYGPEIVAHAETVWKGDRIILQAEILTVESVEIVNGYVYIECDSPENPSRRWNPADLLTIERLQTT
ncbi:MAG: hypothetical protein IPL86_19355 [Flavobacteriales bacterium]|nr:hypothetical protein [Flavobacteriales bacterium]